uniref:Uncharacterized protein n=1 Tax=Romanomermis culicivorax TaxID=13658 RepID=A0A915KX00_ROMCU
MDNSNKKEMPDEGIGVQTKQCGNLCLSALISDSENDIASINVDLFNRTNCKLKNMTGLEEETVEKNL